MEPSPRPSAPPVLVKPARLRVDAALAAIGVLLAATCALASLRMPLWRYFPAAGISVDFVHMLGPGWERPTALYLGFVVATFALYALSLLLVWRAARVSLVVLLGVPVLVSLALLPMYPPTAMDMFHYQAMGRILWVFHANPLTTPQGAFPYPIGISWSDLASPYGPLWSLLVAPATLLPGSHFLAGLLAFKAMSAVSLLGCAALILVIVHRTRPGAEAFAVVLFAWNPFVLVRVVGDGHNDLWMMLCVLLALERMQRARWTTAIIALTLGVLLKFVPAVLGPLFLLYIWRHTPGSTRARAREMLRATLPAAVLVVLAYAAFWDGPATFDNVRKESAHLITSTPVLLQLVTSRRFDEPLATSLALWVTKGVFAAFYVPLLWQARRDFDRLVAMSFAVLFLYLVIACAWFRPWYMLWPVSIAAFRARGWLGATAVTITVAGACPDLVEQFRTHWPLIASYDRAIAAPIVLAFLPPLVVWLQGVSATRSLSLEREVEPG
jgi:hypothetical protein